MNTKSKSFIAILLLIAIGIGGGLTFAQSTDSNLVYFPIIHKPLAVRVDDSYIFNPKGQNWRVVGKVTNVSSQTVYDVHLAARLFSNDELVEVITGTTALPATFPFDSNLFELFPKDPYYVNQISVEVIVDSWSFEHDPEYLPLWLYFPDPDSEDYIVWAQGAIDK